IPSDMSAPPALAPEGYRIARLETEQGDRLKLVMRTDVAASQLASPEYVLDRSGFAYLTYIVPDLEVVLRALIEANAIIRTGAQPIRFKADVAIAFVEDPDGNILELVERHDLETYRPSKAVKF